MISSERRLSLLSKRMAIIKYYDACWSAICKNFADASYTIYWTVIKKIYYENVNMTRIFFLFFGSGVLKYRIFYIKCF